MRKRISIDSLIRQFLAAKQSLLNEKAEIENQLKHINDALAQASIPLDLERLPLGRTPEPKLKARKKQVRGNLVPVTSSIDASVPHPPPGSEPVASENIVVFESSGFQPTSSRATKDFATPSEAQMIEHQGSSATLGGDAQEKPLRTMDRIALL